MTKKILMLSLFTGIFSISAIHAANPASESVFLRNVEIIQEPGILFVDRIVDGRAYGMDGEVAIRMLKLANGQFLLSPQWLSAEAHEFNARMCESTGGVPVNDERAISVIGETTILAKCSRDKSNLKDKAERNPLLSGNLPLSEPAANTPTPLHSYPCDIWVAPNVSSAEPAGQNFPFIIEYSVSIPGYNGQGVGSYSVGGNLGGKCGGYDSGEAPNGMEFTTYIPTACNFPSPGLILGEVGGTVTGSSESCFDHQNFTVWIY